MLDHNSLILLDDDQMQRFIVDGFIVLKSGLSASFHDAVHAEMAYALENEIPHPGDNIVPRVPALNTLCDDPVVRGALTSILGRNFDYLPHRFPHNSEPLPGVEVSAGGQKGASAQVSPSAAFHTQPRMARGSISASAWHQDGHASCGRSRWHTVRAANVFYFPHDTPMEMGPTRFLAGSHLYATLHDIRAEQAVMEPISAGSVIIAHFDLAHAGSPNLTDTCRYMMKFVAVRTQVPSGPEWDHKDAQWKTTTNLPGRDFVAAAWKSQWNWLRGVSRSEGIEPVESHRLPSLLAALQDARQAIRLEALYLISALGAPAVDPLIDSLVATAGKERHLGTAEVIKADQSPAHLKRFFSEGQFLPEDAAIALAAIGAPAVRALIPLLKHEDPWIRLNAVYALGDMGPMAIGDEVRHIAALLEDQEDCVVRGALDALCVLGQFGDETVGHLTGFLKTPALAEEGEGGEKQERAHAPQFRYLSTLALLSWTNKRGLYTPELESRVEDALLAVLNEPNGYPPLIACSALERMGTVKGLRSAIAYLRGRCWDSAQNRRDALSGAWTRAHRRSTLARLTAADASEA